MSVIFSNCMDCEHFQRVDEDRKYICSAFPEGIPLKYMFRKEQKEDDECNNGIKFTKQ
jgi:hypothetical protein